MVSTTLAALAGLGAIGHQVDPYQSSGYQQAQSIERSNVRGNVESSRNPVTSGVIPEGFNQRIFNQQNDSLDFEPDQSASNQAQQFFKSPLTGEMMKIEEFTHNNMQPFFGGQVRQNTMDGATAQILENHTGSSEVYREKTEIKNMFNMERDVGNVFGSSNYNSEDIKLRYNPSQKRQNELPIAQIRVGPGLNQGYGWKPSGGLNQANSRDFVLPKNVNQMRTVDNPKLNYKGRLIMGFREGQRGVVAPPKKNRPETFYRNTSDRYFKTGGAFKKPRVRSECYIKPTHRKNTKSYYGSAAPIAKRPRQIPGMKKSNKNTYRYPGWRNVNGQGKWKQDDKSDVERVGDYGRNAIEVKPQERDVTQKRNHYSNVKSLIQAITMPILDIFRETRKENFIGNPRPSGNMNAQIPSKLTVRDPEDIMRTTIKETTIDNDHTGNLGAQLPSKLTVRDPDDVMRTTIKETTIDNDHTGNLGAQLPSKLTVHDPDDIMRATIKETTIDNDHSGHLGAQLPSKLTVHDPDAVLRTTIKELTIVNDHTGYIGAQLPAKLTVYDPEDVMRTTIKETTIDNPHNGFFSQTGASKLTVRDPGVVMRTTIKEMNIDNKAIHINLAGPVALTVYDPDDVMRTTIKETTIDNDHMGNVQGTQGYNAGYAIAQMYPKDTQKQFLSDHYYQGHADGQTGAGPGRGYLVSKVEAKNTQRQFQTDYPYQGHASHHVARPKSYAGGYAARLNPNKEKIAVGRTPTRSNVKLAVGKDLFNHQTKKIEGDVINIREPYETRSYSIPPQQNQCGLTSTKDKLSEDMNRERINPALLSAHRDNPYTQKLDSVYPY